VVASPPITPPTMATRGVMKRPLMITFARGCDGLFLVKSKISINEPDVLDSDLAYFTFDHVITRQPGVKLYVAPHFGASSKNVVSPQTLRANICIFHSFDNGINA